MTKLVDCKYRIGMTVTLDDSKTHKLVWPQLFGHVNKVTSTKQLIDKKQLADLKVYCLILNYTDEDKKTNSGVKYYEELEWLVLNEQRNKYLRNLVEQDFNNTLCLFQLVEKHGKQLYELIKNKVGEDRKVFSSMVALMPNKEKRLEKLQKSLTTLLSLASCNPEFSSIELIIRTCITLSFLVLANLG